jgi:hypothetical protein
LELEPTTIDSLQLIKSVQIVCRESHPIYVGVNPDLYDALVVHNITKKEIDPDSSFNQRLLAEDATKRATFREVMAAYDRGQAPQIKFDVTSIPFDDFSRKGHVDEFLGTVWFIEELAEIADQLLRVPDKKEALQRCLEELNQKLPSTVYVPLSKLALRRSAVLHIPPSEARVFKTNTKAPYLIIVEVFDPYEETQQ